MTLKNQFLSKVVLRPCDMEASSSPEEPL